MGRFFSPKTRHADPAVRLEAVAGLTVGDEEAERLAREDPDADVRAAAIDRVRSFETLQQCVSDDSTTVRQAAQTRWQTLVCDPDLALADRLAELQARGDTSRCQRVVRTADAPELRLAAVNRILTDADAATAAEPLMAQLAATDASADVRLAALAGVRSPKHLEQVAHDSRKRDKRVHKLAREQLQTLRAAQTHREQVLALADKAQALARAVSALAEPGPNVAASLQLLEEQWRAALASGLPVAGDPLAVFEQSAKTVREGLAQARAVQAGRDAVMARMRSLADAADPSADELEAFTAQWSAQEGIGESQAREFDSLARRVRDGLAHRERDSGRIAAAESLLQRAATRLEQDQPLRADAVTTLEERFARLRLPEDKAVAGELKNRFAAVRDRTADRLVAQREARERRLAEISTLIGRMEASLTEGRLAEAIAAHDGARHRLRDRDLPKGPVTQLNRRLQKHESRIDELRKWRHFGTDVARERLCEQAERLAEKSAAAPVQSASAIRDLRKHWQKLDRTDGPAAEALWQRFNTACEIAYAPCQAHFDAQSKDRSKNLETRRAICDRLATLERDTDWAGADYRRVLAELREIDKQWRHAGPVDRRERKRIEDRYASAAEAVDERLNGEREREVRRRRGLIRMIQGLSATEDVRKAADAVRDARRSWAPTVGAARDVEQALWSEFSEACAAIENRRDAERADFDKGIKDAVSQREELMKALTGVIDELRAARVSDPQFAHHLNHAKGLFDTIRSDWESAGQLPSRMADKLERRYSGLCDQVRQEMDRQRHRARDAELDGLRVRAGICAGLEQAALAGDGADPGALQAQAAAAWANAGPADKAQVEALESRYRAATLALAGDAGALADLRQALDANLERRRELCLSLEVLTGVESPPEEQAARMALRVARLGQALAAGGDDPARMTKERREIERAWCVCGPVAPEAHADVEARFARALSAAGARDG